MVLHVFPYTILQLTMLLGLKVMLVELMYFICMAVEMFQGWAGISTIIYQTYILKKMMIVM